MEKRENKKGTKRTTKPSKNKRKTPQQLREEMLKKLEESKLNTKE